MGKVNPFNNENCEIQARIIFEDWATVPMIRIVKLLGIYGDKIYNYRSIAIMIGCGLGTAHRSVAKLIQEKYLIESNGDLRLNQPHIKGVPKMEHKQSPVPPTEPDVPKMEQSVPPMEPNSIREIIEENKEEVPPPNLTKTSEPLVQYQKDVWITDKQYEAMCKEFTHPTEVQHWLKYLAWYLDENPKWAKERKSHARAIVKWRTNEIASKTWFLHPDKGWGYYYDNVVERLKKGNS